jgi:hypothetical protein
MEEVRPEQRPAAKWNVVLDDVEVGFTGVTAYAASFDISLAGVPQVPPGAGYLLSMLTI